MLSSLMKYDPEMPLFLKDCGQKNTFMSLRVFHQQIFVNFKEFANQNASLVKPGLTVTIFEGETYFYIRE